MGLVVGIVSLVGGGDGEEEEKGPALALAPGEDSWIAGQASLTSLSEYLAIAGRAETLARRRSTARERDLARREAEKEAAREREQEEVRRRFEEAKRRAEAEFRRKLAAARLKKLEAERRIAALKRKRARERAEAERKRRIAPGEECDLPEVRDQFDCLTGKLPVAK